MLFTRQPWFDFRSRVETILQRPADFFTIQRFLTLFQGSEEAPNDEEINRALRVPYKKCRNLERLREVSYVRKQHALGVYIEIPSSLNDDSLTKVNKHWAMKENSL